MTPLKRWLKERNGATAIEYALMAAGISLTIAATVFAFGQDLISAYNEIQASITGN